MGKTPFFTTNLKIIKIPLCDLKSQIKFNLRQSKFSKKINCIKYDKIHKDKLNYFVFQDKTNFPIFVTTFYKKSNTL